MFHHLLNSLVSRLLTLCVGRRGLQSLGSFTLQDLLDSLLLLLLGLLDHFLDLVHDRSLWVNILSLLGLKSELGGGLDSFLGNLLLLGLLLLENVLHLADGVSLLLLGLGKGLLKLLHHSLDSLVGLVSVRLVVHMMGMQVNVMVMMLVMVKMMPEVVSEVLVKVTPVVSVEMMSVVPVVVSVELVKVLVVHSS